MNLFKRCDHTVHLLDGGGVVAQKREEKIGQMCLNENVHVSA